MRRFREISGADVEASSAWIVERLSEVLKGVDVPVDVTGHTDDVPPAAIQVTAFGEYRPIDTNETAEGRARNRRVELFYSRQSIEDRLLAQPGRDPVRN